MSDIPYNVYLDYVNIFHGNKHPRRKAVILPYGKMAAISDAVSAFIFKLYF